MESEGPKRERTFVRRRVLRPGGPAGNNGGETKKSEYLFFQVHFQPVPGARKTHFAAVRPKLTERMQEMIRHGTLIFAGGYPSSIGGMWLLKVKSKAEAERLVMDHPAVACNLLTYRLLELQDPAGVVIQQDRAHSLEHIES